MKSRQKMAAIVVAVLLAAASFGIYWTQKPFATLRIGFFGTGGIRPETLVDQTPLTTAQSMAQLPNSPAEQRLSQEALRIADHEVDLAFAAALRNADQNPAPLSPEAKKISDRLARAQKSLDADAEQVVELTAADGKATGSKKEKLDDDLNLAKSQLELDQDEVANAKQDLIRAGGDPKSVIQQMFQAHEAASHNTATATAAATPPSGHGLVSLYQEWSELHQKEGQLQAAEKAAESAVTDLTAKHDALKAKLDGDKGTQAGAGPAEAAQPGAAKTGAAQTAAPQPVNGVTAAISAASEANSGEEGEGSSLVDQTKRRAIGRKTVGSLAMRSDDEKQLAKTYNDWFTLVGAKERNTIHKALISIGTILGVLLAGIFFDDWIERLLGRTSVDRRQVETLRTITRVTLQVLAVIMVLLVVLGPPSQLGTFLGLAGAGLTVALKDFIVGFIGWFVLMGKNGVRLGDWVEINGVTGEVVELGMFHTVLLETGNWTDSGHPTGRRVTFTNSFAIEGHYFNFSTSGQWLWDELQIILPAGKDPYPIVAAIEKKVTEATAESARLAEEEWKKAARSRDMKSLSAAPAINVKPVAGGIEIGVRYITRAHERYQLRAELNQAAVRLIGQDSFPAAVVATATAVPKPA